MRANIARITFLVAALCTVALATGVAAKNLPIPPDDLTNISTQLGAEVIKSTTQAPARPLPLASHWKFIPLEVQFQLLADGHSILPFIGMPLFQHTLHPDWDGWTHKHQKETFQHLEKFHLPFAMVYGGGGIEDFMCKQSVWFTSPFAELPLVDTPCLVDDDGNIQGLISPVGPIEQFYNAGFAYGQNEVIHYLAELYPDPPLVEIVSNNEAAWAGYTWDKRYKDGLYTTPDWRPRMKAFFQGFRAGLPPAWGTAAKFVGFNINPAPRIMGLSYYWHQLTGWRQPGDVMNTAMGVWDGGSSDGYLRDFQPDTDFQGRSPQVELMNYVPFLEHDIYPADPNWWMELSTWDGEGGEKYYYDHYGQTLTPERYQAMTQFDLWLLRPRTVREFRSGQPPLDELLTDFTRVTKAVDNVWKNPDLTRFWRYGTIVPAEREHPYGIQIITPFPWPRFFALETNLPTTWYSDDFVPVYALAYVIGEYPAREWLVYAHSPTQDRHGVEVTIPGYQTVYLGDVLSKGSFYVVNETFGSVRSVELKP